MHFVFPGGMTNPARRIWVGTHVARCMECWKACGEARPAAAAQYSQPEQKKREKAYDEGIRTVEDELGTKPRTAAERAAQHDRLIVNFGCFATTALGLEDD